MNDGDLATLIVEWSLKNIGWIIVFISGFIEITPIKFNPVTAFLNLIYKPIREEIRNEISKLNTEINSQIDSVKNALKEEITQIANQQEMQTETVNQLIKSIEMNEISRIRWEIIQFSNSIENKQLHIRDEYRHIIDDNKRYHMLIEKYELENGVIDEEYDKIIKHYNANKGSSSVYF